MSTSDNNHHIHHTSPAIPVVHVDIEDLSQATVMSLLAALHESNINDFILAIDNFFKQKPAILSFQQYLTEDKKHSLSSVINPYFSEWFDSILSLNVFKPSHIVDFFLHYDNYYRLNNSSHTLNLGSRESIPNTLCAKDMLALNIHFKFKEVLDYLWTHNYTFDSSDFHFYFYQPYTRAHSQQSLTLVQNTFLDYQEKFILAQKLDGMLANNPQKNPLSKI